jgi:hypothetical protein
VYIPIYIKIAFVVLPILLVLRIWRLCRLAREFLASSHGDGMKHVHDSRGDRRQTIADQAVKEFVGLFVGQIEAEPFFGLCQYSLGIGTRIV